MGLGMRITSTSQLSPAFENTSRRATGDPKEMRKNVPPTTSNLREQEHVKELEVRL